MTMYRKPTVFSSNARALAAVGTRMAQHGIGSVECGAPSLTAEGENGPVVVPIVGTRHLRQLDKVRLAVSVANEGVLTTVRFAVAEEGNAIGVPCFDKESSMSVAQLWTSVGRPLGFTALRGVVEVDSTRTLNTFELFGEQLETEELVNVTAEYGVSAQNLAADSLVYVLAVTAGQKLPPPRPDEAN